MSNGLSILGEQRAEVAVANITDTEVITAIQNANGVIVRTVGFIQGGETEVSSAIFAVKDGTERYPFADWQIARYGGGIVDIHVPPGLPVICRASGGAVTASITWDDVE